MPIHTGAPRRELGICTREHAQRGAAADIDVVFDIAALERQPGDPAGNRIESVRGLLRRDRQVFRAQDDVDRRAGP